MWFIQTDSVTVCCVISKCLQMSNLKQQRIFLITALIKEKGKKKDIFDSSQKKCGKHKITFKTFEYFRFIYFLNQGHFFFNEQMICSLCHKDTKKEWNDEMFLFTMHSNLLLQLVTTFCLIGQLDCAALQPCHWILERHDTKKSVRICPGRQKRWTQSTVLWRSDLTVYEKKKVKKRLLLVWLLRPLTYWLNELSQFNAYYQSLGSLTGAILLFACLQKSINVVQVAAVIQSPARSHDCRLAPWWALCISHPVIIFARLEAQKTLTAATSGG